MTGGARRPAASDATTRHPTGAWHQRLTADRRAPTIGLVDIGRIDLPREVATCPQTSSSLVFFGGVHGTDTRSGDR